MPGPQTRGSQHALAVAETSQQLKIELDAKSFCHFESDALTESFLWGGPSAIGNQEREDDDKSQQCQTLEQRDFQRSQLEPIHALALMQIAEQETDVIASNKKFVAQAAQIEGLQASLHVLTFDPTAQKARTKGQAGGEDCAARR